MKLIYDIPYELKLLIKASYNEIETLFVFSFTSLRHC